MNHKPKVYIKTAIQYYINIIAEYAVKDFQLGLFKNQFEYLVIGLLDFTFCSIEVTEGSDELLIQISDYNADGFIILTDYIILHKLDINTCKDFINYQLAKLIEYTVYNKQYESY